MNKVNRNSYINNRYAPRQYGDIFRIEVAYLKTKRFIERRFLFNGGSRAAGIAFFNFINPVNRNSGGRNGVFYYVRKTSAYKTAYREKSYRI